MLTYLVKYGLGEDFDQIDKFCDLNTAISSAKHIASHYPNYEIEIKSPGGGSLSFQYPEFVRFSKKINERKR